MKHLSTLGNFEVLRPRANGLLELRHAPTGLKAGCFSHLRVRTFKAALAGVNDVESRMRPAHLASLRLVSTDSPDGNHSAREALEALTAELRHAFPNGAWSR